MTNVAANWTFLDKVGVIVAGTSVLLVLADTRYAPVAVAFLGAVVVYELFGKKGG